MFLLMALPTIALMALWVIGMGKRSQPRPEPAGP